MYGVQIAFRDYSTRKGILNSAWVGLAHFRRFVNFTNFSLLLKNTLSISMYALLTFPCAIIFALMINELRNEKFKKIGLGGIDYSPLTWEKCDSSKDLLFAVVRHYMLVLKDGVIPPRYLQKEN